MPFHFDYEETFPTTDFNQINLDWILQLATQLKETAESGGFDGTPGEPGTATNGIAFIEVSDTFSDITDALDVGNFPVLKFTINGNPLYMPLVSTVNNSYWFSAYYSGIFYMINWNANNALTIYNKEFVEKNNAVLTGQPVVTTTPPPSDSSIKIANTQFVQLAVQTGVQNAIEQLVIAPFSESFKQALLQLARKVAYIDGQGQTYYDALYNALYPPINVDSIAAVWNPPLGYVVYDTTPLDSLKTNLTVTATYDDQSTAVLDADEYVLSGVLAAGTSVITVTYAGVTTTFNVTVVANVVESISATFTQGGAVIYESDSLSELVPYLTVTATYTNLNTVYVDYPDYTLSGTLTTGTSSVTVSYEGKTDTFNVTVTSPFITLLGYGIGPASGNNKIQVGVNNNRACIAYATGVHPYHNDTGVTGTYYPVPIPSGATSLIVTMPSALYVGVRTFQWAGTQYNSNGLSSPWTDSANSSFDVTSYNDGSWYCCFTFKVGSAGTTDMRNYDMSGVTVSFT